MASLHLLAILGWSFLLQGHAGNELWQNVRRGLQMAQEGEAD